MMDQVSPIYNPGNDVFGDVKRARAGPGPDQPGQALPGGTPHAVRGVPGHPIVGDQAESSSVPYTRVEEFF